MSNISLARKKELQEPDKILVWLNNAALFLKENKKKVYIVLGIITAILVVVSSFFAIKNHQIKKAAATQQDLISKYETLIEIDGFEKAYAQTKNDIDAFLKQYGSTATAKIFGLSTAHIAYEAKDYERALTLYNQALNDFSETKAIRSLIISNIAIVCEALGQYQKAIGYFQEITQDINAVSKDEALFHLGYLYGKVGDAAKSKESYSSLLKYFPNSTYAEVLKEKTGE